jgi:aspartate/methionine/tyrosine aminotransferase
MPNNLVNLSARMAHIAPFEVMEIQTAARALEALGHDVIHMEIGEPDFPTPPQIIAAATAALQNQKMYYTSALGIMPLREAIAQFYADRYGVTVSPSRVVVTAGSSAALLLTMGVLINPGDGVLMADPGYPCNRHFVRAMGGVPQCIPASAQDAYQLTAKMVIDNWQSHTRAALIATPSNPTGTIVTPSQIAQLHQAVCKQDGTLIVDEIYQGLTYGVEPATALTTADNIFVVNSFSKYFQMTGWRLGWMVVPENYVREVEKLAQNLFISASTPAQYAALAAFSPDTIGLLESRREVFKQRRDALIPALKRIGFQVPVTPEGAFYVYADCSNLSNDSFELARKILQQAHVAVTPGKDFGSAAPEKHIRFAYTQTVERLLEAIERIERIL